MTTDNGAAALALEPRVEGEEGQVPTSVVLPLPADRIRLRRVDVWLSVTRRDDGKTADAQHAVFSRNTSGDSLRFYLPSLPQGQYDAEVKAVALIDGVEADGTLGVQEKESRVVLAMTSGTAPASGTPAEEELVLQFHFKQGQANPLDSERGAARSAIDQIGATLASRRFVRAQIDCWSSTEGDGAFNRRLSEGRCDWFKHTVWERIQPRAQRALVATSHGAEELPTIEPSDGDAKVLEEARRSNRVVVLKLRTSK
jgi:hypothetical protein